MAGPPPYNYLTGRACPQRDAPAIGGMWAGNANVGAQAVGSGVYHFPGYSSSPSYGYPPSDYFHADTPPRPDVGPDSTTFHTPRWAYIPAWWTGTISVTAVFEFWFYQHDGYWRSPTWGDNPTDNDYYHFPYPIFDFIQYTGQQARLTLGGMSGTFRDANGITRGPDITVTGIVSGTASSGGWSWLSDTPANYYGTLYHGPLSAWTGVGHGCKATQTLNMSKTGTFGPGYYDLTTTVNLNNGSSTLGRDIKGGFYGSNVDPWRCNLPTHGYITNEGFEMWGNVGGGGLTVSAAGAYTETHTANPPPSLNLCPII